MVAINNMQLYNFLRKVASRGLYMLYPHEIYRSTTAKLVPHVLTPSKSSPKARMKFYRRCEPFRNSTHLVGTNLVHLGVGCFFSSGNRG